MIGPSITKGLRKTGALNLYYSAFLCGNFVMAIIAITTPTAHTALPVISMVNIPK